MLIEWTMWKSWGKSGSHFCWSFRMTGWWLIWRVKKCQNRGRATLRLAYNEIGQTEEVSHGWGLTKCQACQVTVNHQQKQNENQGSVSWRDFPYRVELVIQRLSPPHQWRWNIMSLTHSFVTQQRSHTDDWWAERRRRANVNIKFTF